MRILIVVGTRPEIIKLSPVIKKIKDDKSCDIRLVHTGQHYDWEMSERFFLELHLPNPDQYLNVGSASPGEQISRIISGVEKVLSTEKPDFLLVEGDTNSVLGAALAANKSHVKVAHVEAGCRSYDRAMPEEINRLIIADCATVHFTPTSTATLNLIMEGIKHETIHFVGHPIVEVLSEALKLTKESKIMETLQVQENEYVVLTMHRHENVENKDRLEGILKAIQESQYPVVFPVHPHTARKLKEVSLPIRGNSIILQVKPVGYIDMLQLISKAHYVLTDSGGIQQECALLHVPCITLRESTEWWETVSEGCNILAGYRTNSILKSVQYVENNQEKMRHVLVNFGDGRASERVVRTLKMVLNSYVSQRMITNIPLIGVYPIQRNIRCFNISRFPVVTYAVIDNQGRAVLTEHKSATLRPGYKLIVYAPNIVLKKIKAIVQ